MLSTQQRITSKKNIYSLLLQCGSRCIAHKKAHPTLSKLMVFPNDCNDIPSPSLDFKVIIKTKINIIPISQGSSMHPATPVVVVGGIHEDYLRP